MKHLFFISTLILLTACSSKKESSDKEVCFLLYDLQTNQFEENRNENSCQRQLPAASTFKVPLAVMAFDSGIFQSEVTPVYEWNGVVTSIAPWNRDHNPTTWIRESVVWMSQKVTTQLGMPKIKNYLSLFKFGNQDMSQGLKYSWLTPAPFINEPMENSLKISGYEQVTFLTKLWREELNVSKKSQIMTRKIMNLDRSHRGSTLIGKTGSGFTDENYDSRIGWFVGHLQNDKSEYIVVLNFTDKQKVTPGTFGGREAKEMALKLLSDKGLW